MIRGNLNLKVTAATHCERAARSVCCEPSRGAVVLVTVVAVLPDESLLSLALERFLGEPLPGFWEPLDAPGLADVAHSRVELPLPL